MTINATTPEARALGQTILNSARFGALAVSHPDTQAPYVSRVAVVGHRGTALMLISTLSVHTQGLIQSPTCALLLGEPTDKGDPLTHPRMTLSGSVALADKAKHKDQWLSAIPKAKLYYDFADFQLYQLSPTAIDLNGGFGKAFRLTPDDLTS